MDAVPAGLPEAGILEADLAQLHRAVLSWYDSRGRRLGFRSTRDPYAVLVSEVMLQQTQVSRVEQAWPRFLARFPTLGTLAEASIGDVLRAWSGLGYNRRALNLHRLARVVLAEHGGRLPADIGALERLPGIGRCTARAVAAIAFGRPVGPIDTNVRRVIGRARGSALGPAIGPASPPARAELQAVCDDLVPNDRPADWTHALMDIGATLCRPIAPDCAACPVRPWCRYSALEGPARSAPRRRAPAGPPFEASTRWLRGRILERLRAADGEQWVSIEQPLGVHDAPAVQAGLAILEQEGLLERSPGDRHLARLPTRNSPVSADAAVGQGLRCEA